MLQLTIKVYILYILHAYITVTVITQPHNVSGCLGGTAMFTCVINIENMNIDTQDIKWWTSRIDDAAHEIKENNLFIITSNISGSVLKTVLMITLLRSAHVGQYWVGMVDDTKLSNVAYLSIIALNGMCICVRILYNG